MATSDRATTTPLDAGGNRVRLNHPDTTIDHFNWDARSLITPAHVAEIPVTMLYNGLRQQTPTVAGTAAPIFYNALRQETLKES